MRPVFPTAIAALLAIGCAGAVIAATKIPDNIAIAIANRDRPYEDVQRDGNRKPGEVLTYIGLKQGEKVVDFIPGTGYYSRIIAGAVGPKGRVYGFYPAELANFIKRPLPKDGEMPLDKYSNDIALVQPVNDFKPPQPVDLVFLSLNYHDLHDPFFAPADVAKINKAIFDALKPGGLYVVIDHSAQKGSGLRDTNTLHRIDEESVKSEVQAAGFKLEGESSILRQPGDQRTLNVFNPSVRGVTDQFILKFRKPK
jgi:predicted methyltransferase